MSHSGQGNKSHFDAAATDSMFCSKLESDSALCCHCLSLISDRLPHRCAPHPQSQMCKKYCIMSLNPISVCELPFHWTGRKFNPLFLGCPPMGLYEVSGSPRRQYTQVALETSIFPSSWLLQALLGEQESFGRPPMALSA